MQEMIIDRDQKKLLNAARLVRKMSYSPYSKFAVGAALLCGDGSIVTGCNLESASFMSICAERNAIGKAISEGKRDFCAIAVIGAKHKEEPGYCPPCGTCRQFMAEFCDPEAFEIILSDGTDMCKVFTLAELLPESFGGR